MSNNPGGDQGDGTLLVQRCPKCREIFYSLEQLKAHIDWENTQQGVSVSNQKRRF